MRILFLSLGLPLDITAVCATIGVISSIIQGGGLMVAFSPPVPWRAGLAAVYDMYLLIGSVLAT